MLSDCFCLSLQNGFVSPNHSMQAAPSMARQSGTSPHRRRPETWRNPAGHDFAKWVRFAKPLGTTPGHPVIASLQPPRLDLLPHAAPHAAGVPTAPKFVPPKCWRRREKEESHRRADIQMCGTPDSARGATGAGAKFEHIMNIKQFRALGKEKAAGLGAPAPRQPAATMASRAESARSMRAVASVASRLPFGVSGTSLAGRMLRPSKRRQALRRRQRQANCLRNS